MFNTDLLCASQISQIGFVVMGPVSKIAGGLWRVGFREYE